MSDPFDEYPSEQSSEEAVVESLGVSDQFIGILSEPSATFENIRLAGPRTKDWLAPLIIFIVISLAGVVLKFSNESFKAEIKQQQIDAMQRQVHSGAMTQEQANAAMDKIESLSSMQMIFGILGTLIGPPIGLLLIAFLYWLILKFAMKATVTYALLMSVCGLTMYIGAFDQLVSLLLAFVTNNFMANLSPNIFMHTKFGTKLFTAMMFVNPLTIWSYYLQGIGFHKVTGISRGKGLMTSFVLFIIWILISVFIGGMFTGGK
jgi:hypothetical protein